MLDAFGGELPHGKTVTNPGCVEPVTARFNTTATEPAGTPTRPMTDSSVTVPAPRTPIALNCPSAVVNPSRVSNTRPGTNDTNRAGAALPGAAGVPGPVGDPGAPGVPGEPGEP